MEDFLTQLTQILVEVRQEVNTNQPQRPAETLEDPALNWTLLRLPAETKFLVPGTGGIQRIAVDLLTRLPSTNALDQNDAAVTLAMTSDWRDSDEVMKDLVLQRLNLYAIYNNRGKL